MIVIIMSALYLIQPLKILQCQFTKTTVHGYTCRSSRTHYPDFEANNLCSFSIMLPAYWRSNKYQFYSVWFDPTWYIGYKLRPSLQYEILTIKFGTFSIYDSIIKTNIYFTCVDFNQIIRYINQFKMYYINYTDHVRLFNGYSIFFYRQIDIRRF